MGFFKKVFGFLGFGNVHELRNEDEHDGNANGNANYNNNSDDMHRNRNHVDPIPGQRRGFSVPVQVPVDRPAAMGPVIVPCINADGGVQGLRWYAKRMRIDEDGDVADEFFHEVLPLPDTSPIMQDQQKQFPRFQVKHIARHAKVRNQAMTPEGKLLHYVDNQGRLQLV